MFIFTKNKTETAPKHDPLEIVVSALIDAFVEGSDPASKVKKRLGQEGFCVDEIELVSKEALSRTKTHFPALKRAVHRAFRRLEKQGFFAAENFGHCADCAARDVFKNARAENRPKCVLYTSAETAQMQATGVCTIRYGVPYVYQSEDSHKARVREVGREVAQALTDAGLAVEWDDDPETAIKARLKEE